MIKYEKAVNISKLVALSSLIWHEYWKDYLSEEQIEYMVDKFQSEKAIQHQIQYEHYTYFYIYYNRELIGYIGLALKDDSIFLSKFYIKKDFRHKGIGTKTFEFIKEAAKQQRRDKITLTVNKHNTNSINAYKKWGFKTVDAVVTDIGGGFVMDDYIMEYKL
ncbi:MAG: GNAT family N-acetyltransferase [Cyanobacteriota bacterium]|nr:GNAT family N-acetyltransferase [Cyanobacteriota bacterium]MDY6359345.1 GNAT family N-acetyltransferase [Cyanobacteriota bacterium]MDY6363921.1 GNAT family N-acetyltransferase [Cyanobacteriota bacterium]MDY6383310.1 GNAT family N-acetyltransferase [Cyanobacteriota bacterium]